MLFRSLTLAFLAVSFVLAIPSSNKGTFVNLRIEASQKTIFEGVVFTRGHDVTSATGGTHHCDGTNNNTNSRPGPTVTTALDDAARRHGFSWDGAFFPDFDDYLVSTIDGEANTDTEFWTFLVNFQFGEVGGCQQQVEALDQVLFAFDGFGKAHILKLTGPELAHKNKLITLTVTDGTTGAPVAGATVNGQTSDANGKVSITFSKLGTSGIKAEKSDSIRSNLLNILVVP
ncbi:hypothetical protein BDQ12DRAFT_686451 [Crucibulum laeve]|uniref:Big-1 domain-containing protein n=1 Tax=Crucibulum laeve TaxID=68775 RepID=A0A5C3LXY6_9AGAR|nr:hypothetical protein BDQ12DRAFT_686451 [Crucibulum laeve]